MRREWCFVASRPALWSSTNYLEAARSVLGPWTPVERTKAGASLPNCKAAASYRSPRLQSSGVRTAGPVLRAKVAKEAPRRLNLDRLFVFSGGDRFHKALDDVVCAYSFGLGVEVGDYAVSHDGRGDGADVLNEGAISTIEDSPGFCAEDEILGGSRAGTPAHPGVYEIGRAFPSRPRGPSELQRVLINVVGDWSPQDNFLKLDDFLAGKNSVEVGLERRGRRLDYLKLFLLARVVNLDAEHESIELSLRERISPLKLDWVLGRKDESRLM